MRQFIVVLTVSCSAWLVGSANVRGQDAEDQAAGGLEEVSKEFREFVVQNAADFDSSIQQAALSIVQTRNYTDARFDALIREVMSVTDRSKEDHSTKREIAVALMPLSTLDGGEQVSMLLDQLTFYNDEFAKKCVGPQGIEIKRFGWMRPDVKYLIDRLDDLREALSVQLETRLAVQRPPAILCAVAELTDEFGQALMPLLLEAAMSDDHPVKLAAISSANEILAKIERTRKMKIAGADVDSKLLSYAERIIPRYDSNKDGALNQSEWGQMLMDPSAADTNGDGSITTKEYALFLQSRSRRSPR